MKKLFTRFLFYKDSLFPIVLIIFSGIIGNTILASAFLVLTLMFIRGNYKIEFLFVLLLLTFFAADNFSGPLRFAQNFRFVVLGVSVLYLFRNKLVLNNLGNYILPFTLLSTFITLLFSPVGISAVLRAIGFWIVALVIFKFYQVLAQKDQQRILELLILTFALYFIISFLFLFLPGISAFKFGRFKGLMGNPNGLGLLGLFCYGVINLIRSKQETSFKNGFFVRLNLLILVLIILSGSRTALFCVIIFELVNRLIKNKPLLILSLLSVSVLYVFINTIPLDTLIDSLGFSDYLRAESIQNASGRTDVWPVAWEEIKNHPWLGNGIMYDDYFITDYAKRTFGDIADRQWGGVWSSYLSLLLDVGVIGFFAYVYFNMKVYKKAINKSLGLAFLAMCVFSGFTESWMASSMNAFTPMMFLFWAIQAQPVITNKN